MPRVEDDRFIIGDGRYVADLARSGEVEGPVLAAEFVRSPEAHARVTAIDFVSAAGETGVAAVFTGADLGAGDFPSSSLPIRCEGMDRPVLAREQVRFAGEPVAMVVAESKERAVDAAASVWVEYDPLPAVVSVAQALSDGVILHPEAGTNVVETWSFRTPGDPPAVSHEVTVEVSNGRLVPNPVELLGVLAVPDGEGLVVYVSHQRPHEFKETLVRQLGIDPGHVRVIVPDVGGAFGMKGMEFPEYVATAAAALKLRRPVEWIQTRREHFLTGTHGRGQYHRVTLGGDRDGRVLRARFEIKADVGAYPHNGARIPSFTRYMATGLYDIAHVEIESTTVVTNLAPTGSYRGAGRPEAAYAIERAIDAYGRSLAVDPFTVRRMNVIKSLPHRTQTGALYDSGDYVAVLDRAEQLVDAGQVRAEQSRRREEGQDPIGLGVGAFVERAGGAVDTGEYARVTVGVEGKIEVVTGSVSAGQGHETAWRQIAASAIGVAPLRVTFLAGDTDGIPRATGTAASRSTMIGGSAVLRAAAAVKRRVQELAGRILEAAPEDIMVDDAGAAVAGAPDSTVTWAELAAAAAGEGEPLSEEEWYVPGAQTFPYGVVVAVVEVEIETGLVRIRRLVAVDDFGHVVNPMIVEGQVHGSLMQGMAQALLEAAEYSPDGQLLTASLMDYMVPVAADQVDLVIERMVHPAPSNELGAKGAGESGCIGAPPAIVNAVLDAMAPFGVGELDMPVTPSQVWEALRAAGGPPSR
jgi:carbon-monoxide dehydrogenase large subunit